MCAKELLEDFFFAAGGNSSAAVHYAYGHGRAVSFRREFNLLFLPAVFLSVREQIDEDLGKGVTVSLHWNRLLRKVAPKRKPAPFQVRAIGFTGLACQCRHIDGLELILLLATLELRKV